MEPLCNPKNDRKVTELPAPPHRPLSHHLLFPTSDKPNWKLLSEHLLKEGRITKEDCLLIVDLATNIFRRERNLLEIEEPVTVVGDIHG
jgi:serine/threonine-protein phosphatase 2B catalytic subunit